MDQEVLENPKSLVELLDQMILVPDPAPVSLWPATPIWNVIAGIAVLILAAFIRRGLRRWNANAPRRAARRLILAANDDPILIADTLRRFALVVYGRDQVASLTGDDWIDFLNTSGPGGFDRDVGEVLTSAPYRPVAAKPALTPPALRWIAAQKVAGK